MGWVAFHKVIVSEYSSVTSATKVSNALPFLLTRQAFLILSPFHIALIWYRCGSSVWVLSSRSNPHTISSTVFGLSITRLSDCELNYTVSHIPAVFCYPCFPVTLSWHTLLPIPDSPSLTLEISGFLDTDHLESTVLVEALDLATSTFLTALYK